MDIDKINFKLNLLNILQDIAGARFVTMDLEMSGINTTILGPNSSKKNLQEVYEQVMEGAEIFQILQWGLTCVDEDLERGYYRAKPYNIYVSSLVSEIPKRYCEDRVFGFSSEACGFLLRNGLDFGKLKFERTSEKERTKHADKEDLVLESKMDIEFYQKVRQGIQQWEQKRSLVRNEFPHIEVFQGCHGEFLQLRRLSQEDKAKRLDGEQERLNKNIIEQRGLRYLFNALTGGDLAGIDPQWYCNKKSKTYEEDLKQTELKIKRITQALKDKKHIIVGHNIFTDLVFLYSSFVRELPLTIADFKQGIRSLFPFIIDTRFLATYEMDSMTDSKRKFKGFIIPVQEIVIPTILLDDKHLSYNASTGKEHEAGFDAWMTAELFLKASAKLYTELIQRGRVMDVSENSISDDQRLAGQDDLFHNRRGDSPVTNIYLRSELSMKTGPAKSIKGIARRTKQRIRAKAPDSNITTIPEAGVLSTEQYSRDDAPGSFYSMQLNSSSPTSKGQTYHQKCTMLPSTASLFWKICANKLRVTASQESVLDLDDNST
ncbi:ribonuclease H-like domain-containing protein [Xylogone sp. PMI_703]|nr:ribonuclease H-like domain-containing protein [Xylogone sp. PMI_703]